MGGTVEGGQGDPAHALKPRGGPRACVAGTAVGAIPSSDARPMARHAACRPAASSLTASVVSGLPLTADANATSNAAILCKLQSPRGAKKDRLLIVRSLA